MSNQMEIHSPDTLGAIQLNTRITVAFVAECLPLLNVTCMEWSPSKF